MEDSSSAKQAERLTEGEVLAEREYHLENHNGSRKVLIQIGFPTRRTEDNRYECVAVFQEDDICFRRPMNGVDALEALQLALEIISVDLKFIVEETESRLSWAEGTRHCFGFSS
jgi:hypothetical protein